MKLPGNFKKSIGFDREPTGHNQQPKMKNRLMFRVLVFVGTVFVCLADEWESDYTIYDPGPAYEREVNNYSTGVYGSGDAIVVNTVWTGNASWGAYANGQTIDSGSASNTYYAYGQMGGIFPIASGGVRSGYAECWAAQIDGDAQLTMWYYEVL